MTISRNMPVSDFHLIAEMHPHLQADGRLSVPAGYNGFVIYGPYMPMSAGDYVVRPKLVSTHGDSDLGTLEICDNGRVLADMPLSSSGVLKASLPDVAGLEIRIRAAGLAFDLESIVMEHKPANDVVDKGAVIARIEEAEARLNNLRKEQASTFDDFSREIQSSPLAHTNFDRVASALHDGSPASSVAKLLQGLDFGAPFHSWLMQGPVPKLMDAWGEDLKRNGADLTEMGFDISTLKWLGSDAPVLSAFMAHESGHAEVSSALLGEPDYDYDLSQGAPMMDELRRVQGGFTKLAALTGEASCFCPFTGAVLTSRHCLPVPYDDAKQVYLFYRFHSLETFYLIVAGFSGGRMLAYFPERNLLLRLAPPVFEWGEVKFCVRQLYKMLMPRAVEVARYLNAPTRPAVLAGTMNNFGHFFWNEMSGLDEFSRKGYLDNISDGILYKYAFINPFEVLAGHKAWNIHRGETAEAFCECVLENNLFCVRPCGSVITQELASSIKALAEQKASDQQQKALSEAKSTSFILWVGLRAHNKVWINQVQSIQAIGRLLSETFPQAAMYLDGTPDCRDLADEIRQGLPDNVQVFDGTNVPVMDTLLWSFGIDAYITTIGSGLVSVTWLAAKPGIAHSETHHLHQMSFWNEVRAEAVAPLAPKFEEVRDLGQAGYCDYEILPEIMTGLMKQLLSKWRAHQ